jgi:hypothetical protein
MFRALGGNRPVGPACDAKYRTRSRAAQYDAVLASGRISARVLRRAFRKSLNYRVERGPEKSRLGRMA